jgi:hypothetical protein
MCFSATANFADSGVLGIVTLTKVKHRRELLFAALRALFGHVRRAPLVPRPIVIGLARGAIS